MSTLHTGQTAPPGRVGVDAAIGVNIESNLPAAVTTAAALAIEQQQTGEITSYGSDDIVAITKAALASMFFPPLPIGEVRARVGVTDYLEVGAILGSAGWGGHVKVQVLSEPFDMAIALQLNHQQFKLVDLGSYTGVIDLTKLARTDLQLPVIASYQLGKAAYVYGGLKPVLSILKTEVFEFITSESGAPTGMTGPMWSGGAFAGFGVGYKYVFLVLEGNALTYKYETQFLGQRIVLKGNDFYPAIGLHIVTW